MEMRLTKESRSIGWREREKREGGEVTVKEKKRQRQNVRKNESYTTPRTSFELPVQLDLRIHLQTFYCNTNS